MLLAVFTHVGPAASRFCDGLGRLHSHCVGLRVVLQREHALQGTLQIMFRQTTSVTVCVSGESILAACRHQAAATDAA